MRYVDLICMKKIIPTWIQRLLLGQVRRGQLHLAGADLGTFSRHFFKIQTFSSKKRKQRILLQRGEIVAASFPFEDLERCKYFGSNAKLN